MSKKLKSLVLLALLTACLLTENIVAEPAAPVSTPPKITVAVYPIKVLAPDKSFESYGPILTSFLVTKLSKSTKLKVIEQEMTAEVEKQLEFANSDKCDATTCPVPEIGKAMAAQKLVVGQVAKLGQKYTANIRVIDIEKKVIDFSVEEQLVCKEEDLDQLMELAALDLREKFGEKVERPTVPAQPQTVAPPEAQSQIQSQAQSLLMANLLATAPKLAVPAPAQPLPPQAPPLPASWDSHNALGIVVRDVTDADKKKSNWIVYGVIVESILPDSPCKAIFPKGSVITAINPKGPLTGGQTDMDFIVRNTTDFRKQAANINPGASVTCQVIPGNTFSLMFSGTNFNHVCAIPPAQPAEAAGSEKKDNKK